MKKFKLKEKSGITMVSLIITIIILMILARDNNYNNIRRKRNSKAGNKK